MFSFYSFKKSVVSFLCIMAIFAGMCWNVPVYATEGAGLLPMVNLVKAESSHLLSVTFTEAADKTAAETVGSYFVDNGVGAPDRASLGTDGKTVALHFKSGFQKNKVYSVFISNVKDSSGKPSSVKKYFVSSFVLTQESGKPGPVITKTKATDTKTVLINFSSKLDRETAENAENYYIVDADENVKTVSLNADGMSVTIGLPDNLTKDYKYCILVRNIKDTDNNTMQTGAALFNFPPVVGSSNPTWWSSHKDLMFTYNHTLKLQYEKEKKNGDKNAISAIEVQLKFVKLRIDSCLRSLYEQTQYWNISKEIGEVTKRNPAVKAMRPDCIAVKGSTLKAERLPVRKDGLFYMAPSEIGKISGIKIDGSVDDKIIIHKDSNVIEMKVESTSVIINGKQEDAGVSPILVDGIPYLPIQYIGEKLGYTVEVKSSVVWQGDTLLLDDTKYPAE